MAATRDGQRVGKDSREAWRHFLDNIDRAREELNCVRGGEHEAWFRGHPKASYSLLPSLFRYFEKPDGAEVWGRVWQKEADLFWEFSARARELHGIIETDWDILFAMQHHGTPTRLLDWTEVVAVAVYFAILNVDETTAEKGNPPCIWVLNPYVLNECSDWGMDLVYPQNLGWDEDEGYYYSYSELLVEDGIGWEWPVAIYPRQRTSRVHAQHGWFTMHGDKFRAIDTFADKNKYLRRVDLPLKALPAAKEFLELAGVNHFSLFPDLQNLSLHLKEKHELAAKKSSPTKSVKKERKSSIDRSRC